MDDEELRTRLEHLQEDLHTVAQQVHAMHAELEEFRPILAAFRPGNGTSDLARAGILRTMRKAARGGGA